MAGRSLPVQCIPLIIALFLSSSPIIDVPMPAEGAGPRGAVNECQDDDISNNDDFPVAQELASGDFLYGTTGLGDTHRIDTFVIRNVTAGRVINASVHITNWNSGDRQAGLLTGWNKYHNNNLAWSNDVANPNRRAWEAFSFLCVVTGDYYIEYYPIAGSGTFNYQLNVQAYDPQDITGYIGTGGALGMAMQGSVSSVKWYPAHWYKFQMAGDQNGMNDYIYADMTLPGASSERLMADLYVRSLEPESWSFWLNHSWWLDSSMAKEEVHAAACHPGTRWYYVDVQATDSSGTRSENYELRLAKTSMPSDGDNHPKNATVVPPGAANTPVRMQGTVERGPDMFDWYKVYLHTGDGVRANLTLNEKSVAIFRLSIYRDNLTAATPEKGYDLMSSWTNKPAEVVLNRISAVASNVSQEDWYYIGVIAQVGLVPGNVSQWADWTVQTAWAKYTLDVTSYVNWTAPTVQNEPGPITIPEDGMDSGLKLNFTGSNDGVFYDRDIAVAEERLNFTSSPSPFINVTINSTSLDPDATVTLRPVKDWNGEEDITFTATDLENNTCSTVVHVTVTPVNDPPFIRAPLPDFSVLEGSVNESMQELRLLEYFSDSDFEPLGDDHLAFSVNNSSYPAAIDDHRLVLGAAPNYTGTDNTTVTLTVTATDRELLTVSQTMNITVMDNTPPPPPPPPPNRPPLFNDSASRVEFAEDTAFYLDLHRLFWDPDGDRLNFSYLLGASPNLTVALSQNGILSIEPAPEYYADRESLILRATDPQGLAATGELQVRIIGVNDPPRFIEPGIVPDPKAGLSLNEGESASFGIAVADVDTPRSQMTGGWSVDGNDQNAGGWSFNWTTGFNDSGPHIIRAWVSDGQTRIELAWNATVNDVNRPPVITELLPRNGTLFPAGTLVVFRAAATDPDGDLLEFTWSLSNGTLLRTERGPSSNFSGNFPGGQRYTVVLEVSDGKGGLASGSLSFEMAKKETPPSTPSGGQDPVPWVIGAVAIALAAGMAALAWRRRKKGPA